MACGTSPCIPASREQKTGNFEIFSFTEQIRPMAARAMLSVTVLQNLSQPGSQLLAALCTVQLATWQIEGQLIASDQYSASLQVSISACQLPVSV